MALPWRWRWLLFLLATSASKTSKNSSNTNGTPITDDGPKGWSQVKQIEQLDTKQLKEFIAPLLNMSNNAYKYPNASRVAGWMLATQVEPLAPSSVGGAHAVVYESSSNKVVVAFRGTATQADLCADVFLFGEKPPAGLLLPSKQDCAARYSNSSLDYVSQSVSYTKMVMKAYPDSPLLLTGHSLGAGLAVAVSALLSVETPVLVPVVAFSAPGTKQIIRARSVHVAEAWGKQAIVFGDEWDTVVNSFWGEPLGTTCLFKHKQPTECSECSKSGEYKICNDCLFQSHGLDNLLRLLDAAVKPSCESNL